MNRTFSATALALATSAMFLTAVAADARGRVAARGPNGAVVATSGANGGGTVRARGARQNADGSVTSGRARATRGPNGGTGGVASTTTVNPDGSATRQSRRAGQNARGSYQSQSDVTRNADGTYSGGRTTTATSNTTGTTYNGSTQIDPATGQPVRSATCTNAAGVVIACPRPN